MIYRTICTQLWTDKKVQRLTVQGKLLFVYLITNPHTHLSGIYYLPKELITKETGLSNTLSDTLFHALSEMERAYYDSETSTVFVVNMFGYQGTGEKNERSAANQLKGLHDTPLIGRFLERYPRVKSLCSDTLLDTVSTLSKRCPSVPDPVPSSSMTSKNEGLSSSSLPLKTPNLKSKQCAPKSASTWAAYCEAYHGRYGVDPVRNTQVNAMLCKVVDKLGATEAPQVTEFYLHHNAPFYVVKRHPVNLLLADAEGLRTQWATGTKATTGEAKNAEVPDEARAQIQRVRANMEARKHGST